jgi:hypothetical protein
MPVNNYVNIQALIADVLARSDLTSQITDAITLFEAEAASELFRTRGTETRTILVPSNPALLTVTGAASSGGLIQITYTPISTNPTLATGNIVNIQSVGGTTEAAGSWVITVTSPTTFTLNGSVFVNAYAGGGTIQQDLGFCTLPADYLGWSRVTFTGNPQTDLEYVAPGVFDQEFPTNFQPVITTSIPEVFTVEAGFLKILPVNPIPLEFLYWQKTPALSGSFNWLATNRPDAYVVGALEKIYGYWIKDFNQAEAYGRKKTEIFNQIKMQRFREFNNLRIRADRSTYGATP